MEGQEHQQTGTQPEPEILYHYTTQEGLRGILESKCIWATHFQYLNDKREGGIVLQVLLNELSSRVNSDSLFQLFGMEPNKTKQPECTSEDTLNQGIGAANRVTSQNVFVASFSKEGNLLSQWRAYTGRSGGYSIGFKPGFLRAAGEYFLKHRSDSFYMDAETLLSCIYYDDKEKQSLENEIERLVSSYLNNASEVTEMPAVSGIEGFQHPFAIATGHFISLGTRSAITKDHGFHEEAEWRLAFLLNQNSIPADLKFRSGSSMLIPYLEVPLRWDDQPIEIKEIIVGPCQYPDSAIKSVEMLLKKEGVLGVEVKDSKIPYRN
jgi:hypothetical protein